MNDIIEGEVVSTGTYASSEAVRQAFPYLAVGDTEAVMFVMEVGGRWYDLEGLPWDPSTGRFCWSARPFNSAGYKVVLRKSEEAEALMDALVKKWRTARGEKK